MTDATTLEGARQSLDAHAWQQAYEGFASLDGGDLSSEDLEHMAEAASTVSSGSIPFGYGDEREVALKGLDEPVHVVAIDWRVGT